MNCVACRFWVVPLHLDCQIHVMALWMAFSYSFDVSGACDNMHWYIPGISEEIWIFSLFILVVLEVYHYYLGASLTGSMYYAFKFHWFLFSLLFFLLYLGYFAVWFSSSLTWALKFLVYEFSSFEMCLVLCIFFLLHWLYPANLDVTFSFSFSSMCFLSSLKLLLWPIDYSES
jgi:hypothetical protein